MKIRFQNISLGIMLFSVLLILLYNIYKWVDYPKMKSTVCLNGYSKEELNFFEEVGFLFQDRACKWKEDILVSTKGSPFKEDESIIDSIVQELTPLIYPVKISRTSGIGNLVVNFTKDNIDRQVMGFTDTKKMSFMGVISQIEMDIFSKVTGQARQACIRHEFLHAMGLEHPIHKNTGTIIESRLDYINFSDSVKLYRYSALDKSSLKILYSDCLPVGLKKKTFEKEIGLKKEE
jgi:hypothetical protein